MPVYRNGAVESITSIINNLNSAKLDPRTEVVIAPPALYLLLARQLANDNIAISAQNVFDKPNGAFTGELSVSQLQDAKVQWALVGHSERRTILKETDEVYILSCTDSISMLTSFSSFPARQRLLLTVV